MPLDPISVYDVPGTIAQQVLDDDVTLTGIRNTIFSPDRLTVQERSGFTQRLKQSMGNHSLTNAAVDIATNPFVWLAVLMSPGYGRKFDEFVRAGKDPFRVQPKLGSMMRSKPHLLSSVGALTGLQMVDNVEFLPVVGNAAALSKNRLVDDWGRAHAAETQMLADTLGVQHGQSLDFRKHGDAQLRSKLHETTVLIENYVAERWREHTVTVPEARWSYARVHRDGRVDELLTPDEYLLEKTRLGRIRDAGGQSPYDLEKWVSSVEHRTVPDPSNGGAPLVYHPVATKELMERLLEERGALALAQKLAGEEKLKLLKMAAGVDGAEGFQVDPSKVYRGWTGVSKEATTSVWDHADPKRFQGKDLVLALTDEKQLLALQKGRISQDEYKEMLTQAFGVTDVNGYMPRNVHEPHSAHPGVRYGEHDMMAPRDSPEWELESELIPRTETRPAVSPEDTDVMGRLYGGKTIGVKQLERDYAARLRDHQMALEGPGARSVPPLMVQRLDGLKSMDRYAGDMAQAYALHVEPPSAEEIAAFERVRARPANERQKELLLKGDYKDPLGEMWGWVHPRTGERGVEFADAFRNRRAMLELGQGLMTDSHAARAFRDVYMPALMGKGVTVHHVSKLAFIEAQRSAEWLANSWVGEQLTGMGGAPKKFVDDLKLLARDDYGPGVGPGGLAHAVGGLFYASHLGLNLGSMVLNLMQPMTLMSTMVGPTAALKGYARAIPELINYATERASLGWSITPEQRLGLMQKHFKHFDVMGLGEREMAAIEGRTFTHEDRHETWMTKAFQLMLKGFEKTEWLNRSVAAHAGEIRLHSVTGAAPSAEYVKSFQRRLMQETQFASDPLNTPLSFLKVPFLNNVVGRQFLTFALRSFTGYGHTAPLMLERGWLPGFMDTVGRSMGTSAVIYDLGKNMLGADLSRGLALSSATQLVGGSQFFTEDKGYVPVPPAIDVPINLVRGLAGGDMDLLRQTLPRLVPGGVALSRALGVLPQTSLAIGLQKTYADYSRPSPDGLVPIYKVDDGSLIDYRSPTEMILRGVGADLGKWQQPGELDNHLVKIRDEAVGYRRQYLMALKNGNVRQAQSVKAEFEKRFKIPLTVTREQVKESYRLSEVGRTERALNRLPRDIRDLYTKVAAENGRGAAMGLPPGILEQYGTATQRDPYRPHLDPLSPEAQSELSNSNP